MKDTSERAKGISYVGRELYCGQERSSFRELETLGYISKKMKRDENGKFVALEYTVHLYPANRSDIFLEAFDTLDLLRLREKEVVPPCRKKGQSEIRKARVEAASGGPKVTIK